MRDGGDSCIRVSETSLNLREGFFGIGLYPAIVGILFDCEMRLLKRLVLLT